MNCTLLTLSSVYPGYLDTFYTQAPGINTLDYDAHNELLINDTTEFAGSYNRAFRKLGVNARCIIANDKLLQDKWSKEHNIRDADSMRLLHLQVQHFKPETLWIENINSVTREWILSVKESVTSIKLVVAYHCSPFTKKILHALSAADLVITCTPGLVNDLKREGINSHLVYHGFDSTLIGRLSGQEERPQIKLLFSGSLFTGGELHNSRIRLMEKIISHNLDLELYVNLEKSYKIRIKQGVNHISGLLRKLNMERLADKIPVLGVKGEKIKNYSGALLKRCHQPLYGIEMYKLLKNSGAVLNIHLGMAGGYAGNMRMFETTGVGSCLLTDNKLNINDLFAPDKEIIVYDSVDDCIEKIRWITENEDKRAEIAKAGQMRTLAEHTVEKRCKQMHDLLLSHL